MNSVTPKICIYLAGCIFKNIKTHTQVNYLLWVLYYKIIFKIYLDI